VDERPLKLRAETTFEGESERVPLGIVLVCITAVVGCSLVLLATNSSLVADGSYYVLSAIKSGQPCACAPGRQGINFVREGPLLIAVHQGVTNTYVLTVLEGIGFLIFPALVWGLALLHTRGSRVRFFLVVISCGLCFATMIFFSVSELTLALPLIVLASVLLTQPTPWSGTEATIAIISTGLLIFSHESILPCAVILAVLAGVRMRVRLNGTDARASIVVLVLAIAVLGAAVCTLVLWPNPNSNTFLNLPGSAVFLFLGAFCLIGWAVLFGSPFRHARLRWAFLVAAVPFTLYGVLLGIRGGPLAAYLTRGPCLTLVAALQLALLIDWVIRVKGLDAKNWTVRLSSGASVGAALFLVSVMVIPIVCGLRWSTLVGDFRHTITNRRGIVPATDIPTSAGTPYLWSWTNTTMSVILRSSTDNAVVENTMTPRLVPFPIASAQQQLPGAYRWTMSPALAPSLPATTSVLIPSSGATLSGNHALDASASANVTSLRFEVTGGPLHDHVVSLAARTLYGWIGDWNTTTVPNGSYTLRSVASTSGHIGALSSSVAINVKNPPTTS
jgi:hypothetical protein